MNETARPRDGGIAFREKIGMQTRTLGRTGLEVTTVGFGSITIGGFFGPVDDAESMQALHASVDAGIRFIDTSDAYGAGRSEQIIGKFLRERPAP
jgi:aryl-alcohol dehydrogenase-like predicted oxidoreductase